MERDESWQRVFDRLPVLAKLESDGIFYVTADELKAHGGREPRLMAKIDTLAERPAPLAEHGLALFPVRNGRYALFPDPDQKSFFRFGPEGDPPPPRPFRSAVDLAAYDTYPRGEPGESQALDFAFLSGLLPAFCGDSRARTPAEAAGPGSLRLTLRGRFFSGDFRFLTPAGGLPVEVSRVQIEVDAGYEGAEGIYLVEAKRGRRDDFHIRQLWYPYLHWTARSRKRVAPIFFAYSNGQYFLTEFAFGEEFGDLRIVRNRCYALEEHPLADLDLRALLAETAPGPEPEGVFPQANDLDKVVDLVQAAPGGLTKGQIAEAFEFDERQGDYYGNAAGYLGLLRKQEGVFRLTPEGEAFNALRSRAERTSALVRIMLRIPGLRGGLSLLAARDGRLEKIAGPELSAIVREHSGLASSTPGRRASTLRAWLAWVMRNIRIRLP